MINAVFLVSVCLGILIEAIERLFEKKHIHDPKLLLLVGCIGLAINLVGLFIFGHSHSHNLPSVVDEDDEDDDDCEERLKLIIAETSLSKADNQLKGGEEALVPNCSIEVVTRKPCSDNSDKKDSEKNKKKKKTAKCHILCK